MNLDLANKNLLDNDIYSNASASGKRDLEALTGCKNPNYKARVIAANLSGQFWLLKGLKKKNEAYKECIETYKSKLKESKDAVTQAQLREAEAKQKAEDSRQELDASKSSQTSQSSEPRSSDSTEEKKFLGMPRTTGIVVTSVVGGLVLLGIGVVVYKKFIA